MPEKRTSCLVFFNIGAPPLVSRQVGFFAKMHPGFCFYRCSCTYKSNLGLSASPFYKSRTAIKAKIGVYFCKKPYLTTYQGEGAPPIYGKKQNSV